MEISDKTAVVTGGASGIGLATAQLLARRGAAIALVDIDAAALEDAVAEVLKTVAATGAPARVEGFQCDVADFEAVKELADDIARAFGKIHIVFNNAGIAASGPIADMSHDDWRWVIDVDLWGPIHGVEAFLPHLRAHGEGGHMLFTSSFAGLVPNIGLGAYCVAKYGVVALAEVLRREERDHGIGVSVLCPMRVATNIGDSERTRDARYGPAAEAAAVPDQSEANRDLTGRVLDVETVAEMVVDAIERNELYILPHEESREFIARRFRRIDLAFDRDD